MMDYLFMDGVPDIEFHFRMSELGLDPEDNDENGEQVLSIIGFVTIEGEPIPLQFYGPINLTVGGKIQVLDGELLNFLPNALWIGDIKIDGGEVVLDQGVTVVGKVEVKNIKEEDEEPKMPHNGGIVTINDATVDGKVHVHGPGSLTIRDGSTITGEVKAHKGTSLVIIEINPNSIGKKLDIKDAETVTITNNSFQDDLHVHKSTTVTIDGNTVDKDLKVDDVNDVTVTNNDVAKKTKY